MTTIDKSKVKWDYDKIDPKAVQWDGEKRPPQTMGDFGRDVALAALRGIPRGGPLMGVFDESMKQAQSMWDRVAYNAGGKATDLVAGKVSPEVAGGIGLAANVATQVAPSLLAGEMAKIFSPRLESWGRSLMQQALKPTIQDLRTGRADRAVQTLLEEGVNPTRAGVRELDARVGTLNNKIKEIVDSSSATISKDAVGARLKDTFDDFMKQVNPDADVATITKAWDQFKQHPLLKGDAIPVQLAQELKQGTYKQLSKKYGQMGSAEVEAQKALARGLKEEIATAVPQVSALNKRESDLINALKLAERRAYMSGNRELGGIAWLANNPGTFAAFMLDRSDAAKGLLGRGLYHGSEQIPANAARLGVGLLGAEEGLPEGTNRAWWLR